MPIHWAIKHARYPSAMGNNPSKMYRRSPLVLLVLLLGTGESGGVSLTSETCVVSDVFKEFECCWLECGWVSEASVNTSVDV